MLAAEDVITDRKGLRIIYFLIEKRKDYYSGRAFLLIVETEITDNAEIQSGGALY